MTRPTTSDRLDRCGKLTAVTMSPLVGILTMAAWGVGVVAPTQCALSDMDPPYLFLPDNSRVGGRGGVFYGHKIKKGGTELGAAWHHHSGIPGRAPTSFLTRAQFLRR